jgi:hypothetical protein
MQLLFTLLSALALVASTTASPAAAAKREELLTLSTPIPITYPGAGTVWHSGETHHVRWDTSRLLPRAQDDRVTIVLGFVDELGFPHLRERKLLSHPSPMFIVEGIDTHTLTLVTDNPLATNVPVMAGKQTVMVPDVASLSAYIIVCKSLVSSLLA